MSDRNWIRRKRRYFKLCKRHPEAMRIRREAAGSLGNAIANVAMDDLIRYLQNPPLPVRMSGGFQGVQKGATVHKSRLVGLPVFALLLRGRAKRMGLVAGRDN